MYNNYSDENFLTLVSYYISSKWILWSLFIYIIYKWSIWTYDTFSKRSIKFIPPFPFLGNFKNFILQKRNFNELVQDFYNYYPNEKIFGIFEFRDPKYFIRDPELFKQLLVKDFDHFPDHLGKIEENQDPLISLNIGLLKGKRWRDVRTSVSPSFTNSKMKIMFQLLSECCLNTVEFLESETKDGEPIENNMKDFFSRFTNDIIATCAFGLNVDSFRDRENDFYVLGQELADLSGFHGLKFLFLLLFPKVFKFLRISILSKKFSQYFTNLIWTTFENRKRNKIYRPDLINLMMEARKGQLHYDDSQHLKEGYATVKEYRTVEPNVQKKITDDDILAQCLTFFMAGFATTGNCMCITAHELAVNQDIQKTLLAEVDAMTKLLNGQPLTYEALHNMPYLDMVISESLRYLPPIPMTERECTKPYTINIDGTTYNFAVGDCIYIPIVAIHHDPKYFPNPSKYDPERFNNANKHRIVPYTYLPFGAGPRNCIGSRFALMQMKAIFYYLLTKFTFEVSEKTQIPLKLAKLQFFLQPEKGFWVIIRPRN